MSNNLDFIIHYGNKTIKFKPPTITRELIKRKYWFGYKEQYYIDYEYCRLGPMNLKDAEEQIELALKYL